MSTQLKTLHLDKEGKSSERTKPAIDELDYLVTFNRSISQAMSRTMQDLSEGVFSLLANGRKLMAWPGVVFVVVVVLLANGRKLMAWPGVVFVVVVVVVVVGVVNNFFPASSPQKLLHRFL